AGITTPDQRDSALVVTVLTSKGAWLNRSSIIFAGSDKWSVDPRVSIATANRREYSLQIQDVDVTDDGPYTCSVQTQHTPRTMQVHLTVQVSPKIFRISSDIVVNEGSNVTLVCLATGKPEPSISWRHISPSGKCLGCRWELPPIQGLEEMSLPFSLTTCSPPWGIPTAVPVFVEQLCGEEPSVCSQKLSDSRVLQGRPAPRAAAFCGLSSSNSSFLFKARVRKKPNF
uniref:Ig-like domain-containing protein n=1 Tax=Meleagris gallopavo TaxID=9103 RepID=G3UTK9_MELGA